MKDKGLLALLGLIVLITGFVMFLNKKPYTEKVLNDFGKSAEFMDTMQEITNEDGPQIVLPLVPLQGKKYFQPYSNSNSKYEAVQIGTEVYMYNIKTKKVDVSMNQEDFPSRTANDDVSDKEMYATVVTGNTSSSVKKEYFKNIDVFDKALKKLDNAVNNNDTSSVDNSTESSEDDIESKESSSSSEAKLKVKKHGQEAVFFKNGKKTATVSFSGVKKVTDKNENPFYLLDFKFVNNTDQMNNARILLDDTQLEIYQGSNSITGTYIFDFLNNDNNSLFNPLSNLHIADGSHDMIEPKTTQHMLYMNAIPVNNLDTSKPLTIKVGNYVDLRVSNWNKKGWSAKLKDELSSSTSSSEAEMYPNSDEDSSSSNTSTSSSSNSTSSSEGVKFN